MSKPNATLSQEDILRFSRHLILPEVGLEGQIRLKNSRVLIVGAGGLGAPVALYLAAAGVGTIGLIDFDRVDLSNLQRQVIHGVADIDKPKVDSAAQSIHAINSNICVKTYQKPLVANEAMDLMEAYDVVVDATDNFPTRYLINDACVLLDKPFVYGSIFRFEGHVSVFNLHNGPCYRCLFPSPPPPRLVPTCSEAGVLGVLPGIIGTFQANETLKFLLGIGEPLSGKLLTLNALSMQFNTLNLSKNKACVVCGQSPSIHAPIDYDAFCGSASPSSSAVTHISPEALRTLLDTQKVQLVDIRKPAQKALGEMENAVSMELDALAPDILDPAKPCVVVCQVGIGSVEAIKKLRAKGYAGELMSLQGGMLSWIATQTAL
jgi:adenylyltransferase/sulfurtransferase